jgi:hypothetical protein
MVLRLKTRESRSLPGLQSACLKIFSFTVHGPPAGFRAAFERPFRLAGLNFVSPCLHERFDAGWSSPVARQAHNLKVVGSNPTPATKFENGPPRAGRFAFGACVGKRARRQASAGPHPQRGRTATLEADPPAAITAKPSFVASSDVAEAPQTFGTMFLVGHNVARQRRPGTESQMRN